jgi:hypothetical protein
MRRRRGAPVDAAAIRRIYAEALMNGANVLEGKNNADLLD